MLLWIEGFEDYGTTTGSNLSSTILGERYTSPTTDWQLCAGRLTGYGLQDSSSSTRSLVTPSLTTADTVVWAGSMKMSAFTTTAAFLSFFTQTTLGVNLTFATSGAGLTVKCGATTLTTVNYQFVTGRWYFLEVKAKCSPTVGTVTIRIDGITIYSGTGLNTQAGSFAYHDIFQWSSLGANTPQYDDIHILDTTGSVNNDFLGDHKVIGLYPTADTATAQWTPSSGSTHYSLVNEGVEGGDSNYIQNTAPGQVDLFTYGGVTGNGTIAGVQINTAVRETDVNAHSLITECVSGGVTSDDAGQGVGTQSYTNRKRIMDTDPNTNATWTVANLNNATFGVKAG
jgi:hypothetical protein